MKTLQVILHRTRTKRTIFQMKKYPSIQTTISDYRHGRKSEEIFAMRMAPGPWYMCLLIKYAKNQEGRFVCHFFFEKGITIWRVEPRGAGGWNSWHVWFGQSRGHTKYWQKNRLGNMVMGFPSLSALFYLCASRPMSILFICFVLSLTVPGHIIFILPSRPSPSSFNKPFLASRFFSTYLTIRFFSPTHPLPYWFSRVGPRGGSSDCISLDPSP